MPRPGTGPAGKRSRPGRAALFEAPIACHEIDRAGVITFVNAAECRLLGLEEREVVGREVWDFVAPEQRERSRQAVRAKLAEEARLLPFERAYERPDGARLVLQIHENLLRDKRGRVAGIRSFLLDITQQRWAEDALRESEDRYRHLVEHASDIIYRADLHGRFVYFNSRATRLLGYEPEELQGRLYLDLIRKDYRAAALRFYRKQIAERIPHTYFEFPAVAKDGRVLWFGQNVELVMEDGQPKHVEAVTRDITLHRQAEEEEAKAREDLEERVRERTAQLELANEFLRREMEERQAAEEERRLLEAQVQHAQRLESLGVLAGGIAHDFNNLLASIMGYASMAAMETPEETRAHESMEEVVRAARAAADLTQQMLAYSGKGQFVLEPLDLSRLVQDLVRLAGALISKKATLRLDLQPGLLAVRGDAAQIRQIVLNLVTNAAEALGDATGTIRIATRQIVVEPGQVRTMEPAKTLPPGDYIQLEVSDTGCGMDRATLGRIFDPFFTTKFTGRGLGLAAVLGIVRAHGGAIDVESDEGTGTRFRVLLPCCHEPVPEGEEPPREEAPAWRGTGLVLVVDDDAGVRELACQILRRIGFDILTAGDGNEAVRCFEERSADVRAVVLDLTMPGMDGAEVYRHIARIRPEVPVVVSSGYNVQDLVERFPGGKPPAFVRKPYLPSQLIAELRRLLEG